MVGILLKSLHTPKLVEMMKAIRQYSPNTEIVVGGYGVAALDDRVPGDKEGLRDYVLENADHLCRGEGVRFMRTVLGDEPVNRPITQNFIPCGGISLPNIAPVQAPMPMILVSLGCPNACDFCNTSAALNHKKEYVAEPAEVYRFMRNYVENRKVRVPAFILFDEDMFLNPEFVRELGRLIRSDRKTWDYSWFSFGSVKALSQYDPEELRECGVMAVWVGVESGLTEDGKTKTGYSKREGTKSIQEVFDGLHRVGIQITGSLILGFDFHTPENIEADIDYFVGLKPMSYQIFPLQPCPGTKLYERMIEERRVADDYTWENFQFWTEDNFHYKNFGPGELKPYYDLAHHKLRSVNGPASLQLFEDSLNAHETFKRSSSEFLRYQSGRAGRLASALRPMITAVKHHPPSPKVIERVEQLERRADRLLGRGKASDQAARLLAASLLDWRLDQAEQLEPSRSDADPQIRWTYYNQPGQSVPTVKRGRGEKPASPMTQRGEEQQSVARLLPRQIRQGIVNILTGNV